MLFVAGTAAADTAAFLENFAAATFAGLTPEVVAAFTAAAFDTVAEGGLSGVTEAAFLLAVLVLAIDAGAGETFLLVVLAAFRVGVVPVVFVFAEARGFVAVAYRAGRCAEYRRIVGRI
jgi:hypothetical protein